MRIHEQLKWEAECLERGSNIYYAQQDKLREKGHADQTDAISYVIRDRLVETGKHLEQIVSRGTAGVGARYNTAIRAVAQDDYPKIAYIGLKALLKNVQIDGRNTLVQVSLDIATHIEVDLKCMMFEATKPAYYEKVVKSLKDQNVSDYIHKQKVLMKKFTEFELEWDDWTPSQKVHIGSRVLRALLDTLDDIVFKYMHYTKGKTQWRLNTTPAFDEWAAEFEKERGLLHPAYLPLKIPPRPWEGLREGGYYSNRMRTSFIKTKGKEHVEYVKDKLPMHHIKAVNKLQRVPWRINTKVLQIQTEIYQKGLGIGIPSNQRIEPPAFPEGLQDKDKALLTEKEVEIIKDWKMSAKAAHGRENQRRGQVLAFMQSHRLATELSQWDKFYFVYSCDFRGRIYCATSGLTPQGSDSGKGLLEFERSVELGQRGAFWLAVHGANRYGIDKETFNDRVKWVAAHKVHIQRTVEDPIGARSWWGAADKPYQFLAFCFEWAACDYGANKRYMSNLPVGLDGSCNGLQHYSAMLRDPVGAAATNLTDSPEPQDIYQRVADRVTEELRRMDHPLATKWLKVGVCRKAAKRPVMTLPYGARQASAKMYVMEYVQDYWSKFEMDDSMQWEVANFLTPILWKAIGKTVVAAREGMDWLRANVGQEFCKWLTPLDFPVFQYYKDAPSSIVTTKIDGDLQLKVVDLDKAGIPKTRQQKNGVAPNFIHSIDSTHMVMVINGTELSDYAMIHDDFGTHAGNTDKLYKATRRAFYLLYRNHSPLVDWAEQMNASKENFPKEGSYNINEILKAKYFFG